MSAPTPTTHVATALVAPRVNRTVVRNQVPVTPAPAAAAPTVSLVASSTTSHTSVSTIAPVSASPIVAAAVATTRPATASTTGSSNLTSRALTTASAVVPRDHVIVRDVTNIRKNVTLRPDTKLVLVATQGERPTIRVEVLNLPAGQEFTMLFDGRYRTSASQNGVLNLTTAKITDLQNNTALSSLQLHARYAGPADLTISNLLSGATLDSYLTTLNFTHINVIEIQFPGLTAPVTIPELSITKREYNVLTRGLNDQQQATTISLY